MPTNVALVFAVLSLISIVQNVEGARDVQKFTQLILRFKKPARLMRGRRDVEDFLQSSSEETSSNEAEEAEENLLIEENHPLHLAAAKGHTPYLEALLNNGSSPHCYNQYGNTLLHLAAMFGHLPSVTLLIERGADIHARNKYGNTLLHCASMNGHRAVIEYLVEKGLDIEATNNAGSTPLHYAGKL